MRFDLGRMDRRVNEFLRYKEGLHSWFGSQDNHAERIYRLATHEMSQPLYEETLNMGMDSQVVGTMAN